jgi:hypothetical protein
LEKLGIELRSLRIEKVNTNRGYYDDYSEVYLANDSEVLINVNRLDSNVVKVLADKLQYFLDERYEHFEIEFEKCFHNIRRDLSADQQEDHTILEQSLCNGIQAVPALRVDMIQINECYKLIDLLIALTDYEKIQLRNRLLRLVKPDQLSLDEFRAILQKF